MPISSDTIRLEPIAGPTLAWDKRGLYLAAGSPMMLGRSSDVDIQLPDKSISRHHAMLARQGDLWIVTDLNSRHGTFLNNNKLDPDDPAPLSDRDQLRLGPWTLRVRSGDSASSGTGTGIMPSTDRAETRVQPVQSTDLVALARQRLELLIDCAGKINGASDLGELAGAVAEAALAGTGYARAALLQPGVGSSVEVLSYRGPPGDTADGLALSQSLIDVAMRGQMARLVADTPMTAAQYGQSIVSLGIHSALAAPVELGEAVEALLYLDARGAEQHVAADAEAFCQALARICGLAIANLRRKELEQNRAQLVADLQAAREAQRLIMPESKGTIGPFDYALETRPGRFVAGDLFELVPLDNNRLAVLLGDVTGKGVGAGITMAIVQTHLRVALRHCTDPATVVTEVNEYVSPRLPRGKFVSLWLGILDPVRGVIEFVDAGHGHWLLRDPGQQPRRPECSGGIPLGIDPDAAYTTETVPLAPGARLLVFSDGLNEQPNPAGELFGVARTIEALAGTTSALDDVAILVAAVHDHAKSDDLADDLTIAAIELTQAPS